MIDIISSMFCKFLCVFIKAMIPHQWMIFETHFFFPLSKIPIISFCHYPIFMQFRCIVFSTERFANFKFSNGHPVYILGVSAPCLPILTCRSCTPVSYAPPPSYSKGLRSFQTMLANPHSFSAGIKHILVCFIFKRDQGENEICKFVLLIKYLKIYKK